MTLATTVPRLAAGSASGAEPRRIGIALLCSMAAHALLLLVVAGVVKLLPEPTLPVLGEPLVLQAVLDGGRTAAQPVEPAPAPPPPEAIVPAAAIPAVSATTGPGKEAGVPGTAPARVTTEPPPVEGSVAVGPIEDPQALHDPALAAITARYAEVAEKPPKARGAVIVAYPLPARRTHTGLRVTAVLEIDERGSVMSTTVVPDHQWFTPAIMDALRNARFAPAELRGKPMPYWLALEFVFAIAPGGTPAAAATSPSSGEGSSAATSAPAPAAPPSADAPLRSAPTDAAPRATPAPN